MLLTRYPCKGILGILPSFVLFFLLFFSLHGPLPKESLTLKRKGKYPVKGVSLYPFIPLQGCIPSFQEAVRRIPLLPSEKGYEVSQKRRVPWGYLFFYPQKRDTRDTKCPKKEGSLGVIFFSTREVSFKR